MHCFCKIFVRNRKSKKLDDLTSFNQIDIVKNFLTSNSNDDEFFSTSFNDIINKRRRKKFRTIKCDKIKIKINDNEIFAIMNSETKINLINNVFVKKFKLVLFDVSFCEIMTFGNNQLKIYEIYFVRLEISNENDVNRFFNENFLEVDLFWNISLNLSWFKLSEAKMNWIADKIRFWQLSIQNLFFIMNRIKKIESEKLINDVIDEKNKIFVMFVRSFRDEKNDFDEIHIERRIQISSILMKIEKKIRHQNHHIWNSEKIRRNFEWKKNLRIVDSWIWRSRNRFEIEQKTFLWVNLFVIWKRINNIENLFEQTFEKRFYQIVYFRNKSFNFFRQKKNENLRLCVNYRNLNLLIIKNRYFLSLIDENLDRFSKIRIYTNFDMIATYNKFRIKKNDEWKTTFRTRYEHFEYIVLFFDFINVFATFQNFVNKILTKRFDFCVIVYLDDIVIYFMNRKQHIENVKWIFQRLKKHKLFINNDKCKWFTNNIEFLNFVVFSKDVQMQKNKIDAIQNWSISKNVFEILNFLKLCNFYRRFIKNFNKLTLFLIFMLKKSANFHKKKIKRKRIVNRNRNRNKKRISNSFLIFEIFETFKLLRQTFLKTFIFRHFDSIRRIRVKIDVSNKIIKEILCQSDDEKHWHSIIYFSKKMISTKCHYEIHDKKLLIIVFVFKQWRHYFEKIRKKVLVLTNHRNFNRFMTTTKLLFR